ncbi:hypothetical protein EJ08DRAFT_583262 [Tothia fuscella]|uniref:nitric-oxide synthase (NADPH) n=1 Tax=Tothia fuscella TaxID=1048955 RepID=A0A9P4NZ74_9PEZI|nr:hypothetical protein EJ08DRAFT_583262 [Tothia fuscella]
MASRSIPAAPILAPPTAELQRIRQQCPILVSTGCTPEFCQSGRMLHTDEPRVGENRAISVVKHEATEFLKEMHRAGYFENEAACTKRVESVLAEIERNSREGVIRHSKKQGLVGGNWVQELKELEFGVRKAWLNSRKCIMRSHYEELVLCDLRHVKSSEGIAQELIKGLIKAYNNGVIQPTVFVWPPRPIDGRGAMIWNPSVASFAGYRMSDSSVLGDPTNVELTKAILELGWVPPVHKGRFDLLPLVTMAENDVPVVIELPAVLRQTIKIRHPQYIQGFDDLDLEWYSYPALSRFGFDIGGVQYTAAPFIGWWTDAEIGVRNLADTSRYNALPEVVKALRSQSSTSSDIDAFDDLPEFEKLAWLSRAQTELTYAVTCSFHRAGVTIVDSLTASAKWCNFDDAFKKQNGYRLPSDPYWLALPQGSILPVWHRGGAPNYQPKPLVCKHVQDPIKAWARERDRFSAVNGVRPRIKTINFREADIVEDYVVLSRDIPIAEHHTIGTRSHYPGNSVAHCKYDMSIFFCSAGVNAEKLANRLHDHITSLPISLPNVTGIRKPQPLNNLDVFSLTENHILLLVVSTTGRGKIPSNGRHFAQTCQTMVRGSPSVSKPVFRYSVFGNGDSRYTSTYNGGAVKIHDLLQVIGGKPLGFGLWEADVAIDILPTASLRNWNSTLPGSIEITGLTEPQLIHTPTLQPSHMIIRQFRHHQREFMSARVIEVQPRPQGESRGLMTVRIEVDTSTWDNLGCVQILPVNSRLKVKHLLGLLGLNGSRAVKIESENLLQALTYETFFEQIVDLEAPFLSFSWLEELVHPRHDKAWAIISEFLQAAKAIDAMSHLCSMRLLGPATPTEICRKMLLALPLLNTRTYSIASARGYNSMLQHVNTEQAQAQQLDVIIKPITGGRFSDTFLNDHSITASLYVRLIDSACGQILRDWNGEVPIILIATGAGFAPVRAFIQRQIVRRRHELQSQPDAPSVATESASQFPMSIFLGFKECDASIGDALLADAKKLGLVDMVRVVLSNVQKHRIQDEITSVEISSLLKQKIMEQNGMVFICSGQQPAKGIEEALDKLIGGSARKVLGARLIMEVF